MPQKGVILVKPAGTTEFPAEWLSRVQRDYPTVDVATLQKDKLIFVRKGESSNITAAVKGLKDNTMLVHFSKYESGTNETDIQPYVVLKREDESPLMVCVIEGVFPNFDQKGSGHDQHFHVFSKFRERLEAMYELANNDLDKVYDFIQKPTFRTDIESMFAARGTISIIDAKGRTKTFARNDLGAQFPWGYVSNTLGYKEADVKDVPKEEAKKEDPLAALMTQAHEQVADKPQEVKEPPKESVQPAPAVVLPEGKKVTPPVHIQAKKLRGWYKSNAGFEPSNWHERPTVVSRLARDIKSLSALKAIAPTEAVPQPTKETAPEAPTPDVKEAPPAPTPAPTPAPAQEAAVEKNVPLLSAEEKKLFKEYLEHADTVKILDRHSRIISDPTKIAEMQKYPDFAEATGIKGLADTYAWPFDIYFDLAQLAPKVVSLLCWNYRNEIMRMQEQIAQMQTKYSTKEAAPAASVPSVHPMLQQKRASFQR